MVPDTTHCVLLVYCASCVDFQKTLVVCQFAPDTLSSRSSYTRGQPVWSEHIAGVVTTQWRRMLGADACTIFQKFCNTQPQHRCQSHQRNKSYFTRNKSTTNCPVGPSSD